MAKGMAMTGAVTHIAGRRREKLEEARAKILELNPEADVHM